MAFLVTETKLFESALQSGSFFMLSCGRVKTELFENADVTASICDIPQHALNSLGITHGHFDYFPSSEFECRM